MGASTLNKVEPLSGVNIAIRVTSLIISLISAGFAIDILLHPSYDEIFGSSNSLGIFLLFVGLVYLSWFIWYRQVIKTGWKYGMWFFIVLALLPIFSVFTDLVKQILK